MNHSPYSSLLLLASVIILLSSCTKSAGTRYIDHPDSSSNHPDSSSGYFDSSSFYLVKTLTEDILGDTRHYHNIYTFQYDSQDRIFEIRSDSSNIDFEYSDNLIKKNVYPHSSPAEHYYYYFNSNSLLDSSVLVTDTSSLHTVYTYNADSQVVQRAETTIGDKGDTINEYVYEYRYDEKGNLLYLDRYFGQLDISRSIFTYSDSANFSTSADMMYPDRIRRPNLLKSMVYLPYAMPTMEQGTYSYESDRHHRIKTETCNMVQPNFDGSSYTRILTYAYY